MWSNLNDSFSAITGHLSNLTQSVTIPGMDDSDSSYSSDKLRNLETQCSLLKKEVDRHQKIGQLFKERWLLAEAKVKGQEPTQVYGSSDGPNTTVELDVVNLSENSDTTSDGGTNGTTYVNSFSTSNSTISFSHESPLTSPSAVEINDNGTIIDNIGSGVGSGAGSEGINNETLFGDLSLDSATLKIHVLEDELKKVSADREHWRHLATQKLKNDPQQEVDKVRVKIEDTSITEVPSPTSISDDKKLLDQLTRERDKLSEDVDRLRSHLIAVEEGYTQEFLMAEEREKELRNRLAIVEEELEQAREQLKSGNHDLMKEQMKTLKTQRDKAQNEASQLDDKLQKYSASVSNLQLVIEQIQKENERKLLQEENRHRNEMAAERAKTEELMKRLKANDDKFAETFEALGAASRLSETIDLKEQTIAQLKNEVSKKDQIIQDLREEIADVKMSCEGKVEKQIMKSLVLGYFTAPHDQRHEVERLLARILDFNQKEMEKAKITIGRGHTRTPSGNIIIDSLSRQFVQFLEQESKPSPGGGIRKPSGPSKELTKDLSKTLLSSASGQRNNPFLASASPLGPISRSGSRASSSNSSSDNLNLSNQLLMGPSLTPFAPVVVSTPDDSIIIRTKGDNGNGSDSLQSIFENSIIYK